MNFGMKSPVYKVNITRIVCWMCRRPDVAMAAITVCCYSRSPFRVNQSEVNVTVMIMIFDNLSMNVGPI